MFQTFSSIGGGNARTSDQAVVLSTPTRSTFILRQWPNYSHTLLCNQTCVNNLATVVTNLFLQCFDTVGWVI